MNDKEREKQISQWEANTFLYKDKYKGGLLLFIKKEIRNNFEEINLIPQERGITLMSNKIDYTKYIYSFHIWTT